MAKESVPKTYEPTLIEKKWYAFWMEHKLFHAEVPSDKPPFCIVLPPPNVTGALHMGHALTATIQDALVRWRRMAGDNALWLPGTDHAGIATQVVVERQLRKEGLSRHDLGREKFLERVWAWKEQHGTRITEQHKALGASLDWDRECFTMDELRSRAVREAFVRLYEEGLIYRANRLINWCPSPSCLTALSDLEVEHKPVQGHFWHIAYPVVGSQERIVVATTRPETMLGDTAVAVHPDDERYRHLVGQEVHLPLTDRTIPVIADEILPDPEKGTGAVKVTPGHDPNDFECGLRHDLPQINILDHHGRLNENVPEAYRGLPVLEARKRVVADLEAQGLLVKVEEIEHEVGHCFRCGSVVEPMLSKQWFVSVSSLAEPAIQAVEEGRTVFYPENWARDYLHWMRNLKDWCISRQLWWGHQIPAWHCGDCGEITVDRTDPEQCSACGSRNIEQDPDVLDTWFSSALWPFSTLGWPDDTLELRTFYPNSIMETGFDIIKFWVARMMMMGIHFMGEVPFRRVYIHRMVVDKNGEKMAKVKGNVVDPVGIVERYGADPLRMTLATLAAQGQNIRFVEERGPDGRPSYPQVETYKRFGNKVWQAAVNFAIPLLQDLEDVDRAEAELLEGRLEGMQDQDRWILSRLQETIEKVIDGLENFRLNDSAHSIYAFFWHELCDWYLEMSKPVLYGSEETSRRAAQATLRHVLDSALRLLHPFMPFVTEEIWQLLPRTSDAPVSIMVAAFPQAREALRNGEVEARVGRLQRLVVAVRNIRTENNVPPGKPVDVFLLPSTPQAAQEAEAFKNYLANPNLVKVGRVEILDVGAEGPSGPVGASVVDKLQVFVPLAGVVDLAAEVKRVTGKLAKAEKELERVRKRLANENFVSRAPREVVERERERLGQLEDEVRKLRDHLGRLQG